VANAMQNYNHSYSYDVLGNILQDAWKSYQYASVNNYLLGNNNVANQYTYDQHGNMLTMPHLSAMIWNYKDELISATNGTFTSYYNYDNEGNRTRKVVVKGNITETRYYIGGYEVYRKFVNNTLNLERTSLSIYDIKISQKELPKKNENDKSVMVTNYEIDTYNRIVLIETKTVENGQPVLTPVTNIRYQYSNHLGSACLELDELGAIISYEEYHPFGTTSYRSGRTEIEVSLKRYKYCGKEKDEETGLYYYGARFYAPWICRFTAVDPLQNKYPEISPYAYCNNNPIKFIDPNGEEIWIIGENGSRTVYTQGMKYEGTDKGVAAKIDTLNQMNLTESGNSLLSNLIGSENTWSIIDHQESGPDNPHVCANDPIKGNSGGQIVTQGFNELSTLSHELFHAYQYEMGQGGGNIPNEIEARLFTSFVSYELTGEGDWRDLFPMGTNASPDYSSSLGAFMRMEEMTETEFNTNFQNLVSGFKTGALSGEYYSNFRENRRNNQINLFKGFYPNIKP
jgi:RHS repeat-associated protein